MELDEIIKAYANQLDAVYDTRTANDNTFYNLLRAFAETLTIECKAFQELKNRHKAIDHDHKWFLRR